MKISILILTIDRFELTRDIFQRNINRAIVPGTELEILVADNGSKDKRVIEYFQDMKVTYHRINSKNEGVGKSFNQLYLRSTGDIICFLGNDIEMPENWLNLAILAIKQIPNPGLIGFDWLHGDTAPLSKKLGYLAHWQTNKNRIFGSWVMERRLIETIGLFPESYDVYGLEDSSMNERARLAGFNSCYLPIVKSIHHGNDVGDQTDYRKMKDASLKANSDLFEADVSRWILGDSIREQLPEMREPL